MSDKDEDSYAEDDTESEEFSKKNRTRSKRASKRNYLKKSNDQAPPLPILYPTIYNNENFTSLPLAVEKTEPDLMSTSFNNVPLIAPYASATNFIPNALVTSMPYVNPLPFNPMINPNYGQPLSNYDNLTSPFRNLSLANRQLTPSVAQSSLNSMSLENITNNSHQINNFMGSTSFTNTPYEPIVVPSSLDNSSNNNLTMSTSFGNNLLVDDGNDDTYVVGTDYNGIDKKSTGLTVLNSVKINSQHPSHLDNLPLCTNDPSSLSMLNSRADLMSTSFNDPDPANEDDENSCDSSTPSTASSKQKLSGINVPPPPPPLITDSLANYIHNLPKKNFTLSRSTPRLTSLDNFSITKSPNVTNVLKNNQGNDNLQSTCKYRLDYDLDYIPFSNSCDNLIDSRANFNHLKTNSYNFPLKTVDNKNYKFMSSSITNVSREQKLSSNIPPLPVISASSTLNEKSSSLVTTDVSSTEKPKVKFSDTVTHILVPNTVRQFTTKLIIFNNFFFF